MGGILGFLNPLTGGPSTITSANSVVTLSAPGIYNQPVQLQGYSADKAWSTDMLDLAETQIGVDGRMTAGYIFKVVKQTFSLQADSPSIQIFETIWAAMAQARDIYWLSGTIDLPSTGQSYAMIRGVLTGVKTIADAAKVLQAKEYTIEWQLVQASLQ
jgi:Tail fiber protein gp32